MTYAMRLGALLLVVACTNGPDGRDTDTGPRVPVFPTDTNEYFQVDSIWLSAELAYDGAQLITAEVDGNAVPPVIYYTLANEDWNRSDADVDNYCVIAIPLVQAVPRLEEIVNPGRGRSLWFAYTWNPETDPALTTCNTPGFELDPRAWGNDPIRTFTEDVDHFVGVGPMTRETFEAVYAQQPELDLVGGAFGLPRFLGYEGGPSARIDLVYAFAFATDPSGRARIEGGGLVDLPSADLANAAGRAPAYYSLGSLVYWQL